VLLNAEEEAEEIADDEVSNGEEIGEAEGSEIGVDGVAGSCRIRHTNPRSSRARRLSSAPEDEESTFKYLPVPRISWTIFPNLMPRAALGHGASVGTTNFCGTLRLPYAALYILKAARTAFHSVSSPSEDDDDDEEEEVLARVVEWPVVVGLALLVRSLRARADDSSFRAMRCGRDHGRNGCGRQQGSRRRC
jgi:hypothetical protein